MRGARGVQDQHPAGKPGLLGVSPCSAWLPSSPFLCSHSRWSLWVDQPLLHVPKPGSARDTTGSAACCVSWPLSVIIAMFYVLYLFKNSAPLWRRYDFALPLLVLHAFEFKSATNLKHWLSVCPRRQITVLDTHDGMGIDDITGLANVRHVQLAVSHARKPFVIASC